MTRTVKKTNTDLAASTRLHAPDIGPIEQVTIGSLKPYPGNARTHDERQLAKIGQSLQAFGWMNPIIADGEGVIIAGHGRWLAARKLGLAHVPVVRVGHLTPDAIKAYRIADNQLAMLSGWDEDLLAIELQHLSSVELDFNIEVIGFDHVEIDLKQGDGPDLLIQGSSTIYAALLGAGLLDQLRLYTFPLVLGRGKRLFGEGTPPGTLKLVDHQLTPGGAVIATYEPAGSVQRGSFGQIDSAPEQERQRKMKDGSW